VTFAIAPRLILGGQADYMDDEDEDEEEGVCSTCLGHHGGPWGGEGLFLMSNVLRILKYT